MERLPELRLYVMQVKFVQVEFGPERRLLRKRVRTRGCERQGSVLSLYFQLIIIEHKANVSWGGGVGLWPMRF